MTVTENNDLVNKRNISTRYGLFAGITISVILFLFQMAGDDFSPMLKLSALIPLAIFIFLAFNSIREKGGSVFPDGVATGLKLSLVASITVVIANVLLFLIANEVSFSKYSILPENGQNFLIISAILFFEIFVFGMIISFIAMQMMKGSSKT